ncbi:MAG: 16S rRNA (guanine(527)-N(7))-methyltransferase RsmG [Bacilli bacterium]|nr:16S rRNA (guanine(527)-N(7))-methyltransferase RsmG [Bacilli bacterium]
MEKMTKEEFIKALKEIGINISSEQLQQLNEFYQILLEWNKKINLTRITSEKEVYLKHFYDSLTLNKVVSLEKIKTVCDVGTGAGFPGIVLKICFPHLKITLVDSLQKRINYLNYVINQLNLKDIEAIHTRGEEFSGKYELVTARAVANIEKLLGYTMHLVDKNGIFVAMKGNIEDELTPQISKKIESKYKIIKIEKFKLPQEESQRSLILIKNK